MRALYEINADLDALLEQTDENGEIDGEALDALLLEKQEKIENVALYVKNLAAEIEAIKTEEKSFKERRDRLEKKKEGLTQYLAFALDGQKFDTARVSITYRKSKAVEIDEAVFWENPAEMFIRYKEPEVDKKAITEALKNGGIVPGATLVEKTSMTIK